MNSAKPDSFLAEIEILPLGPKTRSTHPFNEIRWSFVFADDLESLGVKRAVRKGIWPVFTDSEGKKIPKGVPIYGVRTANMIVGYLDENDWDRIKIGAQFHCMEGHRIVAHGTVTSLKGQKAN